MTIRRPLTLILENTELGTWALTHALEAEGFEVHTASSWLEASACLARASYRLALVAVSSEQENASDVLKYVRQYHPSTRLILLADQDDVTAVRVACGPKPIILAKPLDLGQMVQFALMCDEPTTDTARD
jgi:DNA-binding NtrC family response regulator